MCAVGLVFSVVKYIREKYMKFEVFKAAFLSAALLCGGAFAEKINFNRDIRPILSDKCFHCHGPDEHERKGKLRLDIPHGEDGAFGLSICLSINLSANNSFPISFSYFLASGCRNRAFWS